MSSSASERDTRECLIRVEGLVNRFGTDVVHDRLDLEIRRGEILGLVGGSGAGKSVLVRSIVGLHRPTAGKVWFRGVDLLSLSDAEMLGFQRCWSVMFQGGALFSGLTVVENVEQPMREKLDLPAPLMRELAELKLRLVGLPMKAGDLFPGQLSGGMVKRAALARALALEPEILFLDEPTAGLDPIAAAALDDLLMSLNETLGLSVIVVTHDLHTLISACDRIAVLVDRSTLSGTLAQLRASEHPWVRDYFHGSRMNLMFGKE